MAVDGHVAAPRPGPAGEESVLVIGAGPVARKVCATLGGRQNTPVVHLDGPGDAELAETVGGVSAAAVLLHDDVAALRYALALAHLRPDLPLTVSVFDRTMAEQLRVMLPQALVISPASLSVPSLIGACMGGDLMARSVDGDERVDVVRNPDTGQPEERRRPLPRRRWRRVPTGLQLNPRHHDAGTRLLLVGLLGLVFILLADWVWLLLSGHRPLESFVDAARVVATVGPGPVDVGGVYGTFSAVAMLATVVLTALFTAGLVDRLLEPRFVHLLGPRSLPRKNHVVVVGIGQVGLRLCVALKAQGVPVVGVERQPHASHVEVARRLGVPVVIGDGSVRLLLERVRLDGSIALAAVGSDDLDNVAVAVAASAVSPSSRIVLRAGEQEAVAETRSLLRLGVVRDVTKIAATFVVSSVLGHHPRMVVADDDTVHVLLEDGRLESFEVTHQDECHHMGDHVARFGAGHG